MKWVDIFQVYVGIFQTYRPNGQIYGIFQEYVRISHFYGFQMQYRNILISGHHPDDVPVCTCFTLTLHFLKLDIILAYLLHRSCTLLQFTLGELPGCPCARPAPPLPARLLPAIPRRPRPRARSPIPPLWAGMGGGWAQHVLPIKLHVYYMVLHVSEYITWTLHLNLHA